MKRDFQIIVLTVLISLLALTSCVRPEETPLTNGPSPTPITSSLPSATFQPSTNITTTFPKTTTDIIETFTPDNLIDPKISVSNHQCVYNGMYFYTPEYGGALSYQYIESMSEQGNEVISNWTGEGKNPFEKLYLGQYEMMIDETATEANGGVPVIIVAYKPPYDIELDNKIRHYRLVSYNMATKELTVITENMGDGDCAFFYLIDDTFYYFMDDSLDSDDPFPIKIHTIKKDGEQHRELPRPFSTVYHKMIMDVQNNKIYFKSLNKQNKLEILVTDLSFKSVKKLTEINHFIAYIDDGYLYYPDNINPITVEGIQSTICNIYRKPLDDFDNAKAELVLENVHNMVKNGSSIIYSTKDDLVSKESVFTPYLAYNAIRIYNIDTKESSIVVDNSKIENPGYESFNHYGDYIRFTDVNGECFVNLKTKEVFTIPENIA